MNRKVVVVAACLIRGLTGCAPSSDIAAVELKAKAVVSSRAITNEIIEAFGGAPYHIYQRSEVITNLQHTPARDKMLRAIWERMLPYPETYSFAMPGGDAQVFIDESGRAAGYYLNVQF